MFKLFSIQTVLRYALTIFFFLAGLNHFRVPEFYISIMPDYLPLQRELVFLSGLAESGLALMLLNQKYLQFARWGLILLLIAVFPANVHMAMHSEKYPEFAPMVLYLRLPMQILFIVWVEIASKNKS